MDVHRARFVPHSVRPITAIAFSRTSDEQLPQGAEQPALRLAIGRENGKIEIWNPNGGSWVQETIFPGAGSKSIDGLLWTREPDETSFDGQRIMGQHRLFSIASSPDITEWDLRRGVPKHKSTGNFSEVWCFAAQPRQAAEDTKDSPKSQDLVAGCGDGSVVLLSTSDSHVQFQRFLARVSGKKAKCMSITYQTRDRILAGFADSNIRVVDTRNGSIIRTMSLGSGVPPAPKSKFVWKVKCLPNGDVVSGDSNGDVVFWDGRSYSLIQKIKGHDSDCIDIVASGNGNTIFTGSLDGRIAVYHNATNPSGRRSWAKIHHRRIHTKSEVKAMSSHDSEGLSVVISGGSDLAPAVTPLRKYGREKPRGLSHLPQRRTLVSARLARLLVSWHNNSISIWRISKRQDVEATATPQPPRRLVAKIALSSMDNIRDAAISSDGKALAVATSSEIKVFQLRKKADSEALLPRKLEVPRAAASTGARNIHFSDDGKWLAIVDLDNEVQVLRLAPVPDKPKHIHILSRVAALERQHRAISSNTAFREYEQTIDRVAFSYDSCVMAVSDIWGHIDTWVLVGHEDSTAPAVDVTTEVKHGKASDEDDSSSDSSDDDDETTVFYGQHWADNPASRLLPTLDSAPLVLSFRPTVKHEGTKGLINGNPGVYSTRHNPHAHSHELPKGDYRLWVMTAKHQMYEFDVLAGRLSDWSRNNPTAALPDDFTKLRDRVIDAVWDVSPKRERIWLYGLNWVFMLDVSGNLSTGIKSKKRRQSEAANEATPKRLKGSGAGGAVIQLEREGLPTKMLRSEAEKTQDVDLERESALVADQDDLEYDAELRLARTSSMDDPQKAVASNGLSAAKWWCTFKYRPILGIVPIEDVSDEDEDKALEVVLVERPTSVESAK